MKYNNFFEDCAAQSLDLYWSGYQNLQTSQLRKNVVNKIGRKKKEKGSEKFDF